MNLIVHAHVRFRKDLQTKTPQHGMSFVIKVILHIFILDIKYFLIAKNGKLFYNLSTQVKHK